MKDLTQRRKDAKVSEFTKRAVHLAHLPAQADEEERGRDKKFEVLEAKVESLQATVSALESQIDTLQKQLA
ncbi:MAG: hypothetical protein WB696_25155, partial [Chthoniobacterales bacterium]